MPCKKRKFLLEEAKKALELALKSNNPRRKEKRFYVCIKCSTKIMNWYHLTSISESDKNKILVENKKKQQDRINTEASYYKQKTNKEWRNKNKR